MNLDEVSTVHDYDEMHQDGKPSNLELKISQQINQFIEEDRGITQAYVFHVESGLTDTIFRFIRENNDLVQDYISLLNRGDAIDPQSTTDTFDGGPTSHISPPNQPNEQISTSSSSDEPLSPATSIQPAPEPVNMTRAQLIKAAMKETGLGQSDSIRKRWIADSWKESQDQNTERTAEMH